MNYALLFYGISCLLFFACEREQTTPSPKSTTYHIELDMEDHVFNLGEGWHRWDGILTTYCEPTIGFKYDIPARIFTIMNCREAGYIDSSTLRIIHEACEVNFSLDSAYVTDGIYYLDMRIEEESQHCIFDVNDWIELEFEME